MLSQSFFYFFLVVTGSTALYLLFFFFIRLRTRRKERVLAFLLNKHIVFPGLFLVIAASAAGAAAFLKKDLNENFYSGLLQTLKILVIGCTGFVVIRILNIVKELTYHNFKKENHLTTKFRKAKTQFNLLQRMMNILIIIGTVSAALMTFKEIRNLGTTLLASAGIVGIIIGFAAQKSLGSLFAGIQIAISQPIRIGDVVVVEEEFGTISEITLTYVIISVWDGRRKIVPINFFLEKSFESWTRISPEVISKVKIRTDYSVPVDQIRKELMLWLNETPLWDKRSAGLLVTDASENTIELRATMSARNSDDAWALECMIREKMITYINKHFPDALPKNRLFLTSEKSDGENRNKSEAKKETEKFV